LGNKRMSSKAFLKLPMEAEKQAKRRKSLI